MTTVIGAEDCLYLDLTAPRDVRPGERLPVLVWLHGGSFNAGGAREFNGARLATAARVLGLVALIVALTAALALAVFAVLTLVLD